MLVWYPAYKAAHQLSKTRRSHQEQLGSPSCTLRHVACLVRSPALVQIHSPHPRMETQWGVGLATLQLFHPHVFHLHSARRTARTTLRVLLQSTRSLVGPGGLLDCLLFCSSPLAKECRGTDTNTGGCNHKWPRRRAEQRTGRDRAAGLHRLLEFTLLLHEATCA